MILQKKKTNNSPYAFNGRKIKQNRAHLRLLIQVNHTNVQTPLLAADHYQQQTQSARRRSVCSIKEHFCALNTLRLLFRFDDNGKHKGKIKAIPDSTRHPLTGQHELQPSVGWVNVWRENIFVRLCHFHVLDATTWRMPGLCTTPKTRIWSIRLLSVQFWKFNPNKKSRLMLTSVFWRGFAAF